MKCPKCNISLIMSEKQGIEIDYCPGCRGIWLDKGEPEKILERSSLPEYNNGEYYNHHKRGHDDHSDDHHKSHGYRYGKRRNLLSELFD
jgi:uncharacterized protein